MVLCVMAPSTFPTNALGGESVPNPIVWQASPTGTTGNEVSPMHRPSRKTRATRA